MDQDDRQDGSNSQNNTYPPAKPTEAAQQSSDRSSESDGHKIPLHTDDTEPNSVEPVAEPIIAIEIEPATAASSPNEGPTDGTEFNEAAAVDPEKTDDSKQLSVPLPVEGASLMEVKNKKRLFIMVAVSIVLLVLVGILTFWLLSKNNTSSLDRTDDTLSSTIEKPKLGVALTIADGTVEYMSGSAPWQVATTATQLQEGGSIRTSDGSRAVLTLDDGSAVRLDANTIIKLKNLSVDEVEIEQINGSIYSRVVPSNRSYEVTAGETTYQALGTAFVTVKNDTENGVQVYQSSVKTNDSFEEVTEGKQFYKKNSNDTLQGKVTTIDIDALVDNAFVNWNLSQDESNTNFKEKLGVLSQVKLRSEEREKERQALEESIKQQAARALKAQQEAERKAKEQKGDSMTLSLSGDTFKWVYTGKAVNGYKLVYSKSNEAPVFDIDDAKYYSDTSASPWKIKTSGKKLYVRVCAYKPDADDKCVDYSNVVVINI